MRSKQVVRGKEHKGGEGFFCRKALHAVGSPVDTAVWLDAGTHMTAPALPALPCLFTTAV